MTLLGWRLKALAGVALAALLIVAPEGGARPDAGGGAGRGYADARPAFLQRDRRGERDVEPVRPADRLRQEHGDRYQTQPDRKLEEPGAGPLGVRDPQGREVPQRRGPYRRGRGLLDRADAQLESVRRDDRDRLLREQAGKRQGDRAAHRRGPDRGAVRTDDTPSPHRLRRQQGACREGDQGKGHRGGWPPARRHRRLQVRRMGAGRPRHPGAQCRLVGRQGRGREGHLPPDRQQRHPHRGTPVGRDPHRHRAGAA